MRQVYVLFILSLVVIISADLFVKRTCPPAKRPPVALPSTEPPRVVEVKAATPEDPGPVGTVVSPIKTLTRTPAETQAETQTIELQAMPSVDHVGATLLPPSNFLHKQFTVTNYSEFAFTVPPHSGNPTLCGNFRAVAKENSRSTSAKPADIDLMVMNEEEFEDFVRGRSSAATYEADPSSNQTIKYAIPRTLNRAQCYHLVFRNSSQSRVSLVEADFTVSFQ
jgi:hypothetical protein